MNTMHAVVRTDNLHGIYGGEDLVSFRYHDGENFAAIDNGNVVLLEKKLPEVSRDMWQAKKPGANEKLGKLVLVASVEIVKDKNDANLDEFYNMASADCRGYILRSGDEFSVTAEALNTATPDVSSNKYLEVDGTHTTWKVTATPTNARAELEAIENEGGYKYYVFRVI